MPLDFLSRGLRLPDHVQWDQAACRLLAVQLRAGMGAHYTCTSPLAFVLTASLYYV